MVEFINNDQMHLPGIAEAEFAANLDDVVERVSLTSQDLVIERDGEPVVVLVHPENYRRLHAMSEKQADDVPEHVKQWRDWVEQQEPRQT